VLALRSTSKGSSHTLVDKPDRSHGDPVAAGGTRRPCLKTEEGRLDVVLEVMKKPWLGIRLATRRPSVDVSPLGARAAESDSRVLHIQFTRAPKATNDFRG